MSGPTIVVASGATAMLFVSSTSAISKFGSMTAMKYWSVGTMFVGTVTPTLNCTSRWPPSVGAPALTSGSNAPNVASSEM